MFSVDEELRKDWEGRKIVLNKVQKKDELLCNVQRRAIKYLAKSIGRG